MTMSPLTPNIDRDASHVVHVAVGVILNDQGRILLALRGAHQHQGGLWEFPGGKIEQNETPQDGLRRELYEELGIEVCRSEPLIQIPHHYPDKSVVLHVWRVTEFIGQPEGKEGQPLRWVAPSELPAYSFPSANRPIVSAVRLPDRLAITGAYDSPRDFEQRLERLLARGIRLVYFRATSGDFEARRCLDIARSLCAQVDAQLTARREWHQRVNDERLGLHLASIELDSGPSDKEWPRLMPWLSASCHTPGQLRAAAEQGVDFALLAPVLPTATHPGRPSLGWPRFAQWAQEARVPVYALGGVGEEDLSRAKVLGGQGIAALSAFWS